MLINNTPFPQFEQNMHVLNLCSPSFLGGEVNKAVFACVCLEKGGFLEFFQLLSYRIFQSKSMNNRLWKSQWIVNRWLIAMYSSIPQYLDYRFPDNLNWTGSTIKPIERNPERNQTMKIRLFSAIQSQSIGEILGNIWLVRLRFDCVRLRFCVQLCSIEIRLCSVEIEIILIMFDIFIWQIPVGNNLSCYLLTSLIYQ